MGSELLVWVIRGGLDLLTFGIVFLAVRHYKQKGVIEVIFHALRWVIAILVARELYPYAADIFRKMGFTEFVSGKIMGALTQSPEAGGVTDSLPIPEFMKAEFVPGRGILSDSLNSVEQAFSDYIAGLATNMAALLAVLLLTLLLTLLIGRALKLVKKIPVLHGVNAVLGALIGAAISVLFIWLFGLIIYLIAFYSGTTQLMEAETNAWVLSFFNRFNPLLKAAIAVLQ